MFKIPKFSLLDMITVNKSVVGLNVSFLFERQDLIQENMSQLQTWCKEGKIVPPKTTKFSFVDVAQAHQLLESGQSMGKIVLTR